MIVVLFGMCFWFFILGMTGIIEMYGIDGAYPGKFTSLMIILILAYFGAVKLTEYILKDIFGETILIRDCPINGSVCAAEVQK